MDLKIHSPLPRKKDFRIGVLGAGFIVNDCHLPAYRKAGFNPVAIASRTREHAARVAEKQGIAKVCNSYEELLDDHSIDVLDIAVPPNAQLALIKAACARKTVKGILAQKPLGMNYTEAVEAVRACERAGIVLAVNQNMRYDQSVRAAKTLLQTGVIGDPIVATIEMRGIPHWMPWQRELGWATLRIMSIHHLDCFRYWFSDICGEPEGIYCSARPDPRPTFPHRDGICSYILDYNDGLRCVGLDDTWTGPAKEGCPGDIYIRWRIEGLNGIAIGDIGWCKDPYTSPSTIRYASKGDANFHEPRWTESWFPDAFMGTMGQLLIALESGTEPAISGKDNLKTMALVEAAYVSSQSKRNVNLVEVENGETFATNVYAREFTPRAQRALFFARQEAEAFRNEFIGSAHLLVGLLRLGSGVPYTMLNSVDVTLDAVRNEIQRLIGRGTATQIAIQYPDELKRVFARAVKCATELKHSYIGTEHLFLAILFEGDCSAAKVLQVLGVEPSALQSRLMDELRAGGGT